MEMMFKCGVIIKNQKTQFTPGIHQLIQKL